MVPVPYTAQVNREGNDVARSIVRGVASAGKDGAVATAFDVRAGARLDSISFLPGLPGRWARAISAVIY